MAKKPTIETVTSGFQSSDTINNNIVALRNAFDNTLSLDGSSPNAMGADLDMNGNNIINANIIYANDLVLPGGGGGGGGGGGSIPIYSESTLPAANTLTGQIVYCSNIGNSGTGAVAQGSILWSNGTSWIIPGASGFRTVSTDADFTFIALKHATEVEHTGTLTANRTITLSTTNAFVGARVRFNRTGSGNYNLSVGGLKNLATNEWCEVIYNGTAWKLMAYGSQVVSGVTTIANGGTGASTALNARINLGLGSIVTPDQYGAVGDGVTDDTTAIQNWLDDICDFITNTSTEKLPNYIYASLGGKHYGITAPISLHGPTGGANYSCWVVLQNGGFKALTGFDSGVTSTTSPRPMLKVELDAFGAIVENIYFDCNRLAGGGILIDPASGTSTRQIFITNNRIVRMLNTAKPTESQINPSSVFPETATQDTYRPYGIRIGPADHTSENYPSAMVTVENNYIQQWQTGDAERPYWSKHTAIGIFAACIDAKFRSNTIDATRHGFVCYGHNNEFSCNHPSPPHANVYYSPATAPNDPIPSTYHCQNLVIRNPSGSSGGHNRILGNYMDNGYIWLEKTNQIIGGNLFTKNPQATYANEAGIAFVATSSAQEMNRPIIYGSLVTPELDYLITYIENGSNTWHTKLTLSEITEGAMLQENIITLGRLTNSKAAAKTLTGGGRSYMQHVNNTGTLSVYSGAYNDDWVVNINENEIFSINQYGAIGLGTSLDEGTAGKFLKSGGASAAPTWSSPALYNQSTASQGPGFSTDTYVTGANIAPPNGSLQIGSRMIIRGTISKTAAGTAAPVFSVRAGANGSTADGSRATFTFGAQTAAADVGTFEIRLTFAAIGASAQIVASARLSHTQASTGLSTLNEETLTATSGTFSSGVGGFTIGLSINAGTSAAWTLSNVSATLENLV